MAGSAESGLPVLSTSKSLDESEKLERIRQILRESAGSNPKKATSPNVDVTPFDEGRYRERLATFNDSNGFCWTRKPKCLSPLVCVRYGWNLVDRDMLQCSLCDKLLCSKLPPVWSTPSFSDSIKSLEKNVKSSPAHHKFCPWPNRPDPASLLEIRLLNSKNAVDDFQKRYTSLSSIATGPECGKLVLPLLSSDIPEELKEAAAALSPTLGCPKTDGGMTEVRQHYEAVILAITGWAAFDRGTPSSPWKTLQCEYCLRNAELMSTREEVPANGDTDKMATVIGSDQKEKVNANEDGIVPKPKRQKTSKNSFHPLEEHRNWCPWVDVGEDNQPSLSGCWWKLLAIVFSHKKRTEESVMSSEKNFNFQVSVKNVSSVKNTIQGWINSNAHDGSQ